MSTYQSIRELKSIIDSQWKNGMLPHIRFVKGEKGYSPDANEWECTNKTLKDKFKTSGITQPPVIGITLNKVIKNINNINNFKKDILYIIHGIELFHDFLFRERDPYNEKLICLIHPWESGLDNSPIFDEENEYARSILNNLKIKQQIIDRKDLNKVVSDFRPGEKDYDVYGKLIGYFKKYDYNQSELSRKSPFRVQDLLFNTLLLNAMKSLLQVYSILSRCMKDDFKKVIRKNKRRVYLLEKSLRNKMYDKESKNYYSYSLNLNKKINIVTIQTLIANIFFAEETQEAIDKINKYQTKESYSFLSTQSNSVFFDPIKYWRGPIWPIINWLIIEELKKINNELAINYANKTLKLISEDFNLEKTYQNAIQLMYFNLVFDEFTTPSKNQYKHGWFWDSAFAAIGWINVTTEKPKQNIYKTIYEEKLKLLEKNKQLHEIRKKLKEKYKVALFDEYYIGIKTNKYTIGEPIGSEMMTWTAAVYIDLYNFLKISN